MLNAIRETRSVEDGLHKLKLEMPESIYSTFYDDINEENAYHILEQYLNYHQDDARPNNVTIELDKNRSIININAELHYLGNDHTDPKFYSNDLGNARK